MIGDAQDHQCQRPKDRPDHTTIPTVLGQPARRNGSCTAFVISGVLMPERKSRSSPETSLTLATLKRAALAIYMSCLLEVPPLKLSELRT